MQRIFRATLTLLLTGGLLASCSQESASPLPAVSEARLSEGATSLSGSLREDSLALVSLYNALDGDGWTRSNYWLSDQPVSRWAGVTVARSGGQPRVVALQLGANNLRGTLPAAIGDLTALESLRLQYNRELTGTLPEEIYRLQQLRTLRLGFTGLTGELSEAIGQLQQLDTLDLRTSPYDLSQWWDGDERTARDHRPNPTTFSGKLPKALGQLRRARVIDFGHQRFTGELPEELGQLTQLRHFSCYDNRLTGQIPASFGGLKSLRTLGLTGNQLTGAIPQELGQLRELRELLLGGNQLSGELPASIGALKNLQHLDLQKNQLSGVLPDALAQLTSLYQIYLQGNRFSGAIPVDFGGAQQPNLLWADLSDNLLTGAAPLRVRRYLPEASAYAQSFGLPDYGYTIFVLSGNRLSGTISAEYLQYPKTLKHLIPQQPGYGFTNLQ